MSIHNPRHHDPQGIEPSYADWQSLPHYYGDIVRELFVGAVVLMLFAAPFYGDSLQTEIPFEIAAAIIVVGLAALTNPWKRYIIVADAVAAGVGVAVYEIWAVWEYQWISAIAFSLREIIAIIFMLAFYFSIKTLRAMVLHQIGERHVVAEAPEIIELDTEEDETTLAPEERAMRSVDGKNPLLREESVVEDDVGGD